MRKPLRSKGNKAQVATIYSLPAPYRGLNLRDRLEVSEPGYASELLNYIPGNAEVNQRSGWQDHATGLPDEPVETLLQFAATATRKQFAACGGGIYDVTAAGAVGAADVSGLTNDRWSQTMHATSGSNYLVCCNGADGVRTYDGSTWATSAITGATAATLFHVVSHKFRLWFAEKDTLNAWYLPTLAIQGAATKFPLQGLASYGGTLRAIEAWSVEDTGTGADDFLAFITSEGECIVYAGTDPSSASTWTHRGTYKIDRPVGNRCTLKFGADLLVLTETGVVSLASVISKDARWAQISELVRPAFLTLARQFGSSFGWQMLHYKKPGWLIVNVPGGSAGAGQYLYNSQIEPPDGWFEFDNHNAYCWGESDGDLYFGGQGVVRQADTGTADGADPIEGVVQWAWSRFEYPGAKRFTMARPHVRSDGSPAPLLSMLIDYSTTGPAFAPALTALEDGGDWDTFDWDTVSWAGGVSTYSQWSGVAGIGLVGAMRIATSSDEASFAIIGVDIAFEPGAAF